MKNNNKASDAKSKKPLLESLAEFVQSKGITHKDGNHIHKPDSSQPLKSLRENTQLLDLAGKFEKEYEALIQKISPRSTKK